MIIDNFLRDLRLGARSLLGSPAFTAVAVLTVAMGIGATTAIFSLLNAVLFRPLPVRDPSRLVWIENTEISGAGVTGMTRSVNLRDWRELNESFESLGCYIAWFGRQQTILTANGESMRIEGAFVDREFLSVLGVLPRLGRGFRKEDGHEAVLLTDRFWRRQFHGDPGLVGRTITISGRPWTVVGVLPASFDFSSIFIPGTAAVDFLRPAPTFGDLSDNTHAVIGRLKAGVTIKRAQAELDSINKELRRLHPDRGQFGGRLVLLAKHVSGQFRRPLLVLGAAVVCVLLIACVNLSCLLLTRAASRRKEIAIRIAMGASRRRLLGQMLVESLLLSVSGGALGVPLSYAITRSIAQSQAFGIPLLETVQVDNAALVFTAVLAVGTGVLFGIVPALQFSVGDMQNALKETGRGSSHGRGGKRTRALLVMSEMALACVLLIGAGFLIRSFERLVEVKLGFEADQVAVWRLKSNRDFKTNLQEIAYYQDLSQRISAVPGVASVGFSHSLPMSPRDKVTVHVPGEADLEIPGAFLQGADEGFFRTLRIPVLAGRAFEWRDMPFDISSASNPVKSVIVNLRLARMLWPGRNPVGKVLRIDQNTAGEFTDFDVIGVVGDIRQNLLEPEGAPLVYVPGVGGQLLVRAKASISTVIRDVRAVLNQTDPGLFQGEFKGLRQLVDAAVSPRKLIMMMVSCFSLSALVLAALGIYGVLSYSLMQRTHEIGIRLALGSSGRGVLWLLLKEGMCLALGGCAIGIAVWLGLLRLANSMLFGIEATDPLTISTSVSLLLAVALVACLFPAWRALRVNPMVALRTDSGG